MRMLLEKLGAAGSSVRRGNVGLLKPLEDTVTLALRCSWGPSSRKLAFLS